MEILLLAVLFSAVGSSSTTREIGQETNGQENKLHRAVQKTNENKTTGNFKQKAVWNSWWANVKDRKNKENDLRKR